MLIPFAENIIVSEDKKELTISLKEAYFSDGSTIESKDVINSIKRIIILGAPHCSPREFIKGGHNLKTFDDDIEGLELINKKTFIIRLNTPTKELFYFLHLTDFAVLHSSQYFKDKLTTKDWQNIVSGPYKLNGKLELIQNDKCFEYNADSPKKIIPKFYDDNLKLIEDIKNEKLHLGQINYTAYQEHREKINKLENIDLFGDYDAIVYLILNINSSKFKKASNRQWVNKQILDRFKVNEEEKDVMKKAFQYFLPRARGYIPNAEVLEMLSSAPNETPEDLKDGFTIRTLSTMKKISN